VLRLFKVQPKNEATSVFTLDEVADIVEESTREENPQDASGSLSAAFAFARPVPSRRIRRLASA
jgi:hypothetical protein